MLRNCPAASPGLLFFRRQADRAFLSAFLQIHPLCAAILPERPDAPDAALHACGPNSAQTEASADLPVRHSAAAEAEHRPCSAPSPPHTEYIIPYLQGIVTHTFQPEI